MDINSFLGLDFAESWIIKHIYGFPRSGTTLFASFSGKRRIPMTK
jgi:hypothetical protein